MNAEIPRIGRGTLNDIVKSNPDILKQWVILISECHQRFKGPRGQRFCSKILFKEVDFENNEAKGFDKKGDWRRAVDPSWARKAMKKKVNGNLTDYDEIGAIYRIVQNLRFGDMVEKKRNGDFRFLYMNEYFHRSTPNAVDAREHARKQHDPICN